MGTIDRVGAGTVVAVILAYVAALMALRLVLSPALEIDEAQFVGAIDWRLIYDNSHPPLYNWLVRLALEATGFNWPLSMALVKGGLLAATHILLFDAARRIGGVATGIGTLAIAALCPQISWMSAHTLAHSVLVMAGSAALIHAAVVLWQRPRLTGFVWLGLAATIAMMAKYNAAILIGSAALVAVATGPRRAVAAHHIGGIGVAVGTFLALSGPSLVAAAQSFATTTERLDKLYKPNWTNVIDVPLIGLDGALSLFVGALAWGAAPIIVLALTARADLPERLRGWRTALVATAGIGFALSFVGVLASDAQIVRERYLTPFFMPLPVAAGLALTAFRWRRAIVALGALAFIAVPIGIAGMVLFDKHRYAHPYRSLAAAVAAQLPDGALAIASNRPDFAVNMTLALRHAGFDAHVAGDRRAPAAAHGLAVWQNNEPPAADQERPFSDCTPGPSATLPYRYFSGRELSVAVELCSARKRESNDGRTADTPL